MVQIEVDVKGIVGMAENYSIDKKRFRELLNKCDKKEFIEYLVGTIEEVEEETTPTPPTGEKDPY